MIDSAIDTDVFRQRLVETLAWCDKHSVPDDPAHSLRSGILRPRGLELVSWLKVELPQAVQALADERARLLSVNGSPESPPGSLANGRLLICTSATESLPDGYVTEESRGFYDDDDMPPWDHCT